MSDPDERPIGKPQFLAAALMVEAAQAVAADLRARLAAGGELTWNEAHLLEASRAFDQAFGADDDGAGPGC